MTWLATDRVLKEMGFIKERGQDIVEVVISNFQSPNIIPRFARLGGGGVHWHVHIYIYYIPAYDPTFTLRLSPTGWNASEEVWTEEEGTCVWQNCGFIVIVLCWNKASYCYYISWSAAIPFIVWSCIIYGNYLICMEQLKYDKL